METNDEKIKRYLQDLHAAECGTEQLVLMHAGNQRAPESVRNLCGAMVMQCRVRQHNIELRLNQTGGGISVSKDWMDTVAWQLSSLWNAAHDNVERMTMDLVKAHAGSHLLQGSYCALNAFADSVGDIETKELASKCMKECHEMAEGMIPLIDRIARYAPVPV